MGEWACRHRGSLAQVRETVRRGVQHGNARCGHCMGINFEFESNSFCSLLVWKRPISSEIDQFLEHAAEKSAAFFCAPCPLSVDQDMWAHVPQPILMIVEASAFIMIGLE